jgi:basic membrane protein A
MRILPLSLVLTLALLSACKSHKEEPPAAPQKTKIGLVLGLGGRGDQSFNDSALRGLEPWASGVKYEQGGYKDVPPEELQASLQASLGEDRSRRNLQVKPLGITPVVLQSQVAEDYEPNLQLLADQGVSLSLAVGFMLENAVEARPSVISSRAASREGACPWACGRAASPTPRCGWTSPARMRHCGRWKS